MMARPEQPPDYVLLTPQSREALLSQWGVTSPTQRELFHKLCAQRRADIDPAPWPPNDLEGLMTKLRDAKVGLIITKHTPEGRKWHKVLLTNEGDPRFWYYFISELYQNMLETNKVFMLKVGFLRERKLMPPDNILVTINDNYFIIREDMAEWIKNERILCIDFFNEKFIVAAKDYPLMINGCFGYLRAVMQFQPNQIAVSRLLKTNLNELNRHLNNKEAGFWKLLTDVLIENKDNLMGEPRQKWDNNVFHAAALLKMMIASQLNEAQRAKDEERQREFDMQAVIQGVLQSPEGSFAPEEVKAFMAPLKEKYGDQFPNFLEEFYRKYTTDETPSGTGLPPIIIINDSWFHRDKLYHYFVRHWNKIQSRIKQEMVTRLKNYIQDGSHSNDLTFAKPENFDNTLRDMIAKESEEVAWILKRPKILAEAAIALKKEVSAAEPLLERFFKPGTMFFKRLSVLLDLDPEDLYNQAFSRLSWLSQFFLFLSGKRTAYLNQLLEVTPRTKIPPKEEPKMSSISPPTDHHAESQSHHGGEHHVERRPRPKPQPVQRQYSEREKNKAWNNFAQNVRKPQARKPN